MIIYGLRSVFSWLQVVFHFFHNSRLVFMVFHGSRLVFPGSRLVFQGSRWVLMVFYSYSDDFLELHEKTCKSGGYMVSAEDKVDSI